MRWATSKETNFEKRAKHKFKSMCKQLESEWVQPRKPAEVHTESFANASHPSACHQGWGRPWHMWARTWLPFCFPGPTGLNLNPQHNGIRGGFLGTDKVYVGSWGWDQATPLIRRGGHLRRPSFHAPESGKGASLPFPVEGLKPFICPSKFSSRFLQCLKHAVISLSPLSPLLVTFPHILDLRMVPTC